MMLLKESRANFTDVVMVTRFTHLKFRIFLSRNYFLPIAVFAFAFAIPIIMFLFNLGNNTERSTVANYLSKIPRKMKRFTFTIPQQRFIWKGSRKKPPHNLFFSRNLTQLNLVIRKLFSGYYYPRFSTIYRCPTGYTTYLLRLNLHFQKTIKGPCKRR